MPSYTPFKPGVVPKPESYSSISLLLVEHGLISRRCEKADTIYKILISPVTLASVGQCISHGAELALWLLQQWCGRESLPISWTESWAICRPNVISAQNPCVYRHRHRQRFSTPGENRKQLQQCHISQLTMETPGYPGAGTNGLNLSLPDDRRPFTRNSLFVIFVKCPVGILEISL